MITLEKFLVAIEPDLKIAIENGRVCLVRHAMDQRNDNDWFGFDELLKFNPRVLARFTAEQPRDEFRNSDFILVFVADRGTRCVLRGAFKCLGNIKKNQFMEHYKDIDYTYSSFLSSKGISQNEDSDKFYYRFEEIDFLHRLYNRLVIDWGPAARRWKQYKLDKEVWEIRPRGFISQFPGWEDVFISHQQLAAIMANPEGNRDWYQFLSEHDGVYVILDTIERKHYVGSAYGSLGIWGRWKGYSENGHNSNVGLIELLSKDPARSEHFRYSLHHVCAKTSKSAQEVLRYEELLKRKLSTRGVAGLNKN